LQASVVNRHVATVINIFIYIVYRPTLHQPRVDGCDVNENTSVRRGGPDVLNKLTVPREGLHRYAGRVRRGKRKSNGLVPCVGLSHSLGGGCGLAIFARYSLNSTKAVPSQGSRILVTSSPTRRHPHEDPREDVTRKMLPWNFSLRRRQTAIGGAYRAIA